MPGLVLDKPICGAAKSGDRGPCQLPAGYGTGHPGVGPCKWHFGSTPTQERKYMLHNLRLTSLEVLQQAGIEVAADITPEFVMREELRRAYIMVNLIETQLDIEDSMWPDMHNVLMTERKHAFDCAAKMISLGIAEREVRVLEAEAMVFATGIRAILDRLNLTEEQRSMAPDIVRAVMAELPSAA